jgi:hypothetical protein
VEASEIRKQLLILSLTNMRHNAEEIPKTYGLLIYRDIA